jgi:hypothetical protein
MDLDSVADELYGVPLEDFTSTRTAREKEARVAGDKALAAKIHLLAKPNQVAWLANQLVRRHGDELSPLFELGADLREASDNLTGDRLREFSRQQRELIRVLVEQAKRLGLDNGKKISEDTARGLEETLHAALADPDAAARLSRGHLAEGMQHVGFGPAMGGLTTAPNRPKPDSSSRRETSYADAERPSRDPQLDRAESERERAKTLAHEAKETLDEARSELDQAEADVTRLEDEVTRLRDELDSAEAEQSRAVREHRRVKGAFDRADRSAQDAVRRLQHAQANYRKLAGS